MILKSRVVFILCTVICLVSLLACQPQFHITSNLIKGKDDILTLPTNLSPDGNWLVQIPFREDRSVIEFYSLEKTPKKVNIQVNPGAGKYLQASAWSPDSTMIAVVGADFRSKCAFDTVAVYNLNANVRVESFVYRLPQNDLGCLVIAWSPHK